MTEGNPRSTHLTAPLRDRRLPGHIHNRIYEALEVLTDRQAERLIKAITEVYNLGVAHGREESK